jgi:hypothetical protein
MDVKLVNRSDSAWIKGDADIGGICGNRQIVVSLFIPVGIYHCLAGTLFSLPHAERVKCSLPRHTQKELVFRQQVVRVLGAFKVVCVCVFRLE